MVYAYGNPFCSVQNCQVPCCNVYGVCPYNSSNTATSVCVNYYYLSWWVCFVIFLICSFFIILGGFLIYLWKKKRRLARQQALMLMNSDAQNIYGNIDPSQPNNPYIINENGQLSANPMFQPANDPNRMSDGVGQPVFVNNNGNEVRRETEMTTQNKGM